MQRLNVAIGLVLLLAAPAVAQDDEANDAAKVPPPARPTIVSAYGRDPSDTALEVTHLLTIEAQGLEQWLQSAPKDAPKRSFDSLQLVLNGIVIPDARISAWNSGAGQNGADIVRIRLRPTENNRDQFTQLLISRHRNIAVSLSPVDGATFSSTAIITLELTSKWQGVAVKFLPFVLLLLFFVVALQTRALREPIPLPDGRRPFSLAKCQAFLWWLVIISAYASLYLTWKSADVMSNTALILLGITSGTGVLAGVINAAKPATTQPATPTPGTAQPAAATQATSPPPATTSETASPAPQSTAPLPNPESQQTPPPQQTIPLPASPQQTTPPQVPPDSKGNVSVAPTSLRFIKDLIEDEDGLSFHRLQLVMWTLVLLFIFIAETYRTLQMPDFSSEVLALAGVSAGTYLTFEYPESRQKPSSPA